MITFFLIAFSVYFLFILSLLLGWQRVVRIKNKTTKHYEDFISIIVPFRNEEKNLTRIIDQILKQHYVPSNYEIILINDHSTDFSVHFAEMAIAGKQNCKLISLAAKEGKKYALNEGILAAQGNIIATTDADCDIPTGWLQAINHSFNDSNGIKFVFGGVQIKESTSFFSKLQALEFCSLIGSGVATLKYGFPTMCNGANLAFLKSAFAEVKGYEGNWHVPSGDDEFLMRKIDRRFPGSVCFLNESKAVVNTCHQVTLTSFINQRLRWAGKWRYNQSLASKLLAVFVFLFQLSFVLLLLFIFLKIVNFKLGLIVLLSKLLIDFLFLYLISDFLRLRWRWSSFFCLQLLYPVYVIFIGLKSQGSHYFWKGRKLTHQV